MIEQQNQKKSTTLKKMDELHWIGKNKFKCTLPKCIQEYGEILNSMPAEKAKLEKYETFTRKQFYAIPMQERLEYDFVPFHCDCHSISLGKTSFPCELCSKWVCQNCTQSDDDSTYCTACFKDKDKRDQYKRKQRHQAVLSMMTQMDKQQQKKKPKSGTK